VTLVTLGAVQLRSRARADIILPLAFNVAVVSDPHHEGYGHPVRSCVVLATARHSGSAVHAFSVLFRLSFKTFYPPVALCRPTKTEQRRKEVPPARTIYIPVPLVIVVDHAHHCLPTIEHVTGATNHAFLARPTDRVRDSDDGTWSLS